MAEEATTWFSTLDADMQAHVVGRGWDKLDPVAAAAEAAKSHYAAQKMIGVPAEQILKWPKDTTDPNYQSVYDRVVGMSTPKEPTEYKFDDVKFKDGSALADEDAAFVRDAAVKYKLPVHVARGLAADLAARADGFAAAEEAQAETAKAANNAFLRAAYGADYDLKVFSATRAAEAAGLPPEVLAAIANLPSDKYKAGIDAFVALGAKMGEAAMLRGGAAPQQNSFAGMSAPEAQARMDALKDDKVWAQKFMAGDAQARDEFTKLTTIITEGRMPRR